MSVSPLERLKRTGRGKVAGLLLCVLFAPAGLGPPAAFAQAVSHAVPFAEQFVSQPGAEIVSLHQLIQKGQWGEARELADELATRFADDAFFQYLFGVLHWRQDDKVAAIQSFRRSEILGLDTVYLRKALGLAYFGINQFKLFQRQMVLAMELDPGDSEPLFHLGRYLESVVDDCGTALTYFQRAAALDRSPRNLYFQGHCLEALSQAEEARESYGAAVEILDRTGEGFGWPYLGLARLSLASDAAQAAAWAEKAVRTENSVAEYHFTLAKAYRQLERLEEAVGEVQTALRLDPQYTAAYYLLFSLQSRLGRIEEARAALDTFHKLNSVYAIH